MFIQRLQPALLLAAALCCTAQTRPLNSHNISSSSSNNITETRIAALVTSSTAKAKAAPAASAAASSASNKANAAAAAIFRVATKAKQNVLNLEPGSIVAVRQSSSIVQDWSLVCKELCGAGLGGVPCASFCTTDEQNVALSQTAKDLLMHSNKSLICGDLCRLRLGGATCDCPQDDEMHEYEHGKEVCNSFCVNGKQTLNGCSLCELAIEHNELISSSAATTSTKATETITSLTSIKLKAGAWTGVHGSIGVDIAASDAETTPDWSELCKSLCKTGDGGSLCKCDLSPFFF